MVCGVEKSVKAVQIWTKGVGTVGPVAQKGQFADEEQCHIHTFPSRNSGLTLARLTSP